MRQNFIGLTLCAMLVALCSFAEAQKEAVPPRVGIIRTGTPPDALLDIFLQGLRDLGYVDGKNILIELRFAEGKPARAAEIAKELAGLKIDAVFTASTPAILAFKHATKPSLWSWSVQLIRYDPALSPVLATRVATSRAYL